MRTFRVFVGGPALVRLSGWLLNTPIRALRRAGRATRWRRFASEYGLRFEANRPDLAERWNFEEGPVPRAGRTRTALHSARNVASGTLDGVPFLTFEAEWAVDEAAVVWEQFRRRQVIVLDLPAAVAPLDVRGRVALDLRGMASDSPAFAKGWVVLAGDERQAHAILTDEVRALVSELPPKEATWQFFGRDLVLGLTGYHGPDAVLRHTESARRLIRAVPAFVWSDASGAAG